jgi:hypothetical protein
VISHVKTPLSVELTVILDGFESEKLPSTKELKITDALFVFAGSAVNLAITHWPFALNFQNKMNLN